jgi:hypothetical protein
MDTLRTAVAELAGLAPMLIALAALLRAITSLIQTLRKRHSGHPPPFHD